MPSKPLAAGLAALLALTVAATESAAQGGLLEQLMRDLLESQRQRQQEAQPPAVVVGGREQDRAGASRTSQIRENLGAFAKETNTLSGLLRKEVHRNRAVAPYLVPMVRVKSRAEMLQRKYKNAQSDQILLADLQELDREWRDTAHGLAQIQGLPAGCRQSIGRLTEICSMCCSPFEIAPQFDRREVARLSDLLAAELHHLERDIEYEVRNPRRAQKLLLKVQRAEGLAKLVGEAAHQGDPLEVVVDAFKRFRVEWRPLAGSLQGLNDRHIERTLAEAGKLGSSLASQLRLGNEIDRQRLIVLAEHARQHIAKTCDSVTLTSLLGRPDATAFLAAAQRLDREANALCECATAGSAEEDLVEHWRTLNASWNAFDALAFRPGEAAPTCRDDARGCLEEFRGVLGVADVFDRREVTRCAAQLASIANEAKHRVGLWRSRPGARVDKSLIREADALISACRALHEGCVGSVPQAQLAADCHELSRRWSRLRPALLACDTVDQRVLRRLSDDATAQLIRLESLLEAAGT